MTVSYLSKIATSDNFRVFKLLLTWKGSIYKTIRTEMLVYIVCYTLISVLHHFALNDQQKLKFESFCVFCAKGSVYVPVGLVLGFYVNLVVTRWAEEFTTLPWPDNLAIYVNSFIRGSEDVPRMIRRNIMRYINTSQILCFMSISSRARRMFPDNQALVEHGFLTQEEVENLESFKTTCNNHFVPIGWAQQLVCKAQKEKYLFDNKRVWILMSELDDFRDRLRVLFAYDWINPPLIYTQIAIITLYSYFLIALFGKQFLDPTASDSRSSAVMYIPIFGTLEFINYIGLLKVAQCLINPFGEDEDDFEVNQIIFRNLEYSLITVDTFHNQCPELFQDLYWDQPNARLIDSSNSFLAGSLGKAKNLLI